MTAVKIVGNISTHALTEGDGAAIGAVGVASVFQLTPSRRATV